MCATVAKGERVDREEDGEAGGAAERQATGATGAAHEERSSSQQQLAAALFVPDKQMISALRICSGGWGGDGEAGDGVGGAGSSLLCQPSSCLTVLVPLGGRGEVHSVISDDEV